MKRFNDKYFVGRIYADKKGKIRKVKKVEKTYIKGRRGVKLYYDSAHYDEYEYDDDYDEKYDKDEVRKVFRKSIRREKMWNYFEYLEGRKIAVES